MYVIQPIVVKLNVTFYFIICPNFYILTEFSILTH